MINEKEHRKKNNKPLPKNAYDNLFIPKQKSYENLFVGGLTEKLSQTPQHFCIYSNYEEIDEIDNENE